MAEAAGIVERDDDGGGGKRTPRGKGCETSEPEPSSDPNPASVSGQHEQGQGEDENAMPNKRPREEIRREDYPSKSAYKKALKDRKRLEYKALKKAKLKEEKALLKKKKLEERKKVWEKLTPDEVEERKKRKKELIKEKVEAKQAKVKRLREAQSSDKSNTIIIDLEFGQLMTESEKRSLAHQLNYCYSNNSKSEKPCKLVLCGLKDVMGQEISNLSGFENWIVGKEEEGYIDVMSERKQDLVYLTADSENVIEKFEPSKAYIIGGIVDRNRHKNVCYEKAKSQNIATARLPILEHMSMNSSCVLTTNCVFSIILKFQECGDWVDALSHIPGRKRG